ncbi:MAG: class I SAM-dependent methyltransferase [Tepidisphaeraceae bacterium]
MNTTRNLRLHQRILRRYELVQREISIGGVKMEFWQIRNPDTVLDQVVEEEDRNPGADAHLPYWAELWDSSLAVAMWLVEENETDKATLDLGCGMGLAGAVAAALGHRVTLADIEPSALLLAQLNTSRHAARVHVRRLDWRRDRLDELFDRILGADVIYDKSQWDHLERFWRAHLTDDGQVVLGEPGRQTGDDFIGWIESRGWETSVTLHTVPTRKTPVRIIRLRIVN